MNAARSEHRHVSARSLLRGAAWISLIVALAGCELNESGNNVERGEDGNRATIRAVSDKTITLVADVWLPYNGRPDAENPGFMIDIARDAFERAGYEVEYLNVPWARAIQGTRNGTYDGIVGTGRDETPDFVFPERELGLASHTFYVLKDASWRFDGLDSLEPISLGVIRDYSYGTLFEDYIKRYETDPNRVQVVGGNTGLSQNIAKLLAGRVDAIVEDRTAFQYHLHMTKTPDDFVEAGVCCNERVYIAFSPAHAESQTYARILSQAMEELRASGRLARILETYGVQDWTE